MMFSEFTHSLLQVNLQKKVFLKTIIRGRGLVNSRNDQFYYYYYYFIVNAWAKIGAVHIENIGVVYIENIGAVYIENTGVVHIENTGVVYIDNIGVVYIEKIVYSGLYRENSL